MSRVFSILRNIGRHLLPQVRLVPVSGEQARRRAAVRGIWF